MAAEALYREDCIKVAPNQKQITSIFSTMKFHPLAKCLPMLPGHELEELAQDIRKNGLHFPITTFEKMILDGRNRWAACKRAHIKPKFVEFEGDDPVAFVMSNNLSRRHLPAGKRAEYAIKIVAAGEVWASSGRPKKDTKQATLDEVAQVAGVSKSTVQRIKRASKKKAAPQAEPPKTRSNDHVFDALGFPIPALALPYWYRIDEVKSILREIAKLRSIVDQLYQQKDPMYSEVNLGYVHVELGNIATTFKGAIPYVVCTLCQGEKDVEDCQLCRGRGLISQFRYENALPVEDREKRTQQIEQLQQATLERRTDNEPELK
jgi:hypothetical protein